MTPQFVIPPKWNESECGDISIRKRDPEVGTTNELEFLERMSNQGNGQKFSLFVSNIELYRVTQISC